MLLQFKQVIVPPGQRILLDGINWQAFESILEEMGEHRGARVAYSNGTLEIMTPLPERERNKEIIGDLVKALLEELDIEFCPLGSTTFKNQQMAQGIEPDSCFYIQNEAAVRDKDRLDLTVDPPPDLAIEIDITSRTHPSIYETLGVPELWRFEKGKLQINILQNGKYVEPKSSALFPNLPIAREIPHYLNRCKIEGRNRTMKDFRAWIRAQQSN
jgi:Uma2 family endonuclease